MVATSEVFVLSPNLRRWILFAALIAVLPAGGLKAQNPAAPGAGFRPPRVTRPASSPVLATSDDYIVSPDDLLEISVFDVPEISGEFRVSPGGSIQLPLVPSEIAAAGLSIDQLSAEISGRLRADGLVSEPQVNVQVKESRVNAVVVTGAVKKPQIYPVFGTTTLLDVLAQAEGLDDDAGGIAIVTRGSEAKRAAAGAAHGQGASEPASVTVDLRRLMQTNDPKLNLVLYPGDRVTVQRAGVVYVVGAVNRPGGFVLTSEHEPMTVLKALALAEDLKPTARANRAMVLAPKSQGAGESGTPVHLQDILAGRAPDLPLRANDILFVPDSNSQRVLRRAAEAAVQAATGVVIWRIP
jgi:polysaccharide biosynthesis/export protein